MSGVNNILDIQQIVATGQTSARNLLSSCLNKIEALEGRLHAIITLNPEAEQTAEALDQEARKHGPRSLLHGIPVVIKDSIATKDNLPTTAGTRALEVLPFF